MTTTTATEAKIVWYSIDTATLNPEDTRLYADYRKINEAAGNARKAFEKSFTKGKDVPQGYKLAISHRFGLSVAVVKDDGKVKSNSKAGSLADFLQHARAA